MKRQEKLTTNRAFQEMRKPAVERLKGRSSKEIAANTHIEFDKETSEFLLSSMGKDIRISYPQYEMTPELDEWHHLVTLLYMDRADGTPLSSQLIAFGDLPGGLARGGGFDRQCEQTISRQFGRKPAEHIQKVCGSLGAEIIPSNADLCAVFRFFPLYPVTLKIWFADEDLDGSGKMLLDKSAEHFLDVEGAVTVGNCILEALVNRYREMYGTD